MGFFGGAVSTSCKTASFFAWSQKPGLLIMLLQLDLSHACLLNRIVTRVVLDLMCLWDSE